MARGAWVLAIAVATLALPLRAAKPAPATPNTDDGVEEPVTPAQLAAATAAGGAGGAFLGAVVGVLVFTPAFGSDFQVTQQLSVDVTSSPVFARVFLDFVAPSAVLSVAGAGLGAAVAGFAVGEPLTPAPLTATAGALAGLLLGAPGACFGAAGLWASDETGSAFLPSPAACLACGGALASVAGIAVGASVGAGLAAPPGAAFGFEPQDELPPPTTVPPPGPPAPSPPDPPEPPAGVEPPEPEPTEPPTEPAPHQPPVIITAENAAPQPGLQP